MSSKAGAVTLACIATLAIAPQAGATETRAEYAAAVNPICVSANQATKRVERDIAARANDLLKDALRGRKVKNKALRRFLRRAVKRIEDIAGGREAAIAAVPPAPGDEMIVQLWLANRVKQRATQNRLGKKFARLFILTFRGVDIENPDANLKPSRKFKRVVIKLGRLIEEEQRLGRIEKTQAKTLGVAACILGSFENQFPLAAG